MVEQHIKMRGHHVEHLAETLYIDRIYGHPQKKPSLQEEDTGEFSIKKIMAREEYYSFINGEVRELEEIILLSPESGIDLPIQIVLGEDSFCNMCPRYGTCI
ncbi:MAG: hypothetical protein WCI72_02385 [archaeon]